jgi:hypothetical protein
MPVPASPRRSPSRVGGMGECLAVSAVDGRRGRVSGRHRHRWRGHGIPRRPPTRCLRVFTHVGARTRRGYTPPRAKRDVLRPAGGTTFTTRSTPRWPPDNHNVPLLPAPRARSSRRHPDEHRPRTGRRKRTVSAEAAAHRQADPPSASTRRSSTSCERPGAASTPSARRRCSTSSPSQRRPGHGMQESTFRCSPWGLRSNSAAGIGRHVHGERPGVRAPR